MNEESDFVFVIVNNIPRDYHSPDLRNFFSQFIETKGFKCFHFRHRPEIQMFKNPSMDDKSKMSSSCCCVVKVYSSRFDELSNMYNRKHWLDSKGESIPRICRISKVKIRTSQELGSKYRTRAEQKQIPDERESFTEADLKKLPELHPPAAMPNGNVGTPTMVFMEAIRQCRLPAVVIKKLGLNFPKMRSNKKYGNVPFDYGGELVDIASEEETVTSASGHKLLSEDEYVEPNKDLDPSQQNVSERLTKKDPETRRRMNLKIEENMIHAEPPDSENDDDSCEEWERHEALNDDPSNQERNKERLFEEEIELKWEKGGSGLVFYTDAQYWQEQEGDFDEQTADDWDVDMSIYYEEGAGDKDSRDHVAMRQEQRRRDGLEKTDRFTIGIAKRHKSEQKNDVKSKIGRFETHTKGIGRKYLENKGWKEGDGLGSTADGIKDALDHEGQNPKDKKGLGYRGEKLIRPTGKLRRAQREVIISTVYDDPEQTDPQDPLLRRGHPYHIKYRDSVQFTKPEESQGYINN